MALTQVLARVVRNADPLRLEHVGSGNDSVRVVAAHHGIQRVASAAHVTARPTQEECVHARLLDGEGKIEARHREAALSVDIVVLIAVIGQDLQVLTGERALDF